MSTVERFLRAVWSKQPGKDNTFFLSVKDWETNEWTDYPQTNVPYQLFIPSVQDLYFAPNSYSKERRRKPLARPGRWLYADLDEVDPRELDIRPTVAWETSPGRWQCLWLLAKPLGPSNLGKLNQKLTYFCGADKGGWSLTKVLRVPGSVSTKHGKDFTVKLLWANGPVYAAADIYELVRKVETPSDVVGDLPTLAIPKGTPKQLLQEYAVKNSTYRMALAADTEGQDRSAVLWRLQRELLEQGVAPEAVFVICKASVWNKYDGQGRENRQLWTEIQRAVKQSSRTQNSEPSSKKRSKSIDKTSKPRKRRVITLEEFVEHEIRKPMWMVEGIWSESAHGIVAGEPKTYKSVLSTDLAVSVASGTKFLDHFPVPQVGPVLLIQKENDAGEVQDRFMRILHSRQLLGSASISGSTLKIDAGNLPPVHLMNNEDFDLTDPQDIRWLRKQARKIGPVLIILDPLYLMTPGLDENSAHEMTPVLERLLRLKQTYNAGTLIIHHFKKPSENNNRGTIARISGTGVFGRWYESALLLERPDEAEAEVRMIPLHRGHPAGGVIYAEFDLGSDMDLHYSVDVESPREKANRQFKTMRDVVKANPDGVTVAELEGILGLTRNGVRSRAERAGLKLSKKVIGGQEQTIVLGAGAWEAFQDVDTEHLEIPAARGGAGRNGRGRRR
jgi:hypothetical protein